MLASEFDNQKSSLRCIACDKPGELYRYSKPPHIGVKCRNCDTWQYWLKQSLDPPTQPLIQNSSRQEEIFPRYTSNQIAQPQTLDERVASLEHAVRVLCQLMTGVKDG